MIRNRIFLKTLAILLIIEIVGNTVWPTVSYALTSGPTAPEATSFEPVDTTDMVNLATGDLAYNIPLLEVPGPAGGYPLSLSYHAGIMPDEEASWVGLGWTLNPGAINRSVNGFADDHNGVLNTNRFFWEGGERVSMNVGVNLGMVGAPGASAGLTVSHDTYQGLGVGAYLSIGIGPLSVSGGIDPYGNPSASLGVSVSGGLHGDTDAADISGSLGLSVSTDLEGVSAGMSGGVGLDYGKGKRTNSEGKEEKFSKGSVNLLGASISTQKGGSSATIVGQSQVFNGKTGRISTVSIGLSLPLPLIDIGFSYHRYWIDQTEKVNTFGALYNPTSEVSGFGSKAYDSYTLPDVSAPIVENPDADKVLGGSFLSYDDFSVVSQGLAGGFRPYSYKNLVFRQNRTNDDTKIIRQYPYDASLYRQEPFEFRFNDDFSNRYVNQGGKIDLGSGDPLNPDFENEESSGENGGPTDGFAKGHLIGSRHIEWYTNDQILKNDLSKRPEMAGFIDCQATGFSRTNQNTKGSQIGGFMITNETGVTYHFALPAYAYDEYQYSENIKRAGGHTFNEIKRPDPYAYTWYLTAVTGPDFIDRGPAGEPDGILNEYDWGYWVAFEYGKWTDEYAWRNPSTKMNYDLDQNFKNFSEGKKELYYLDAIRTKSHTAFFFKDIREDAKSSLYLKRDVEQNSIDMVVGKEKINLKQTTKSGAYAPKAQTCSCEKEHVDTSPSYQFYQDYGTLSYVARPVSTLKLDTIILVENKQIQGLPISKIAGSEYGMQFTYSWNVEDNDYPSGKGTQCDFSDYVTNPHLYQNVLDKYDLQVVKSQLLGAALRVIKFDHDYSLSPETINSFSSVLVKQTTPLPNDSDYPRLGKLTLRGLEFLGKAGASMMPPTRFNYDFSDPKAGSGSLSTITAGSVYNIQSIATSELLEEGDIIHFKSTNNKTIYAVVTQVNGVNSQIRVVGKEVPSPGTINWTQTKNPPYNAELRDFWGMYKSDYTGTITDEKLRMPTETSSKGVDAWSLREVTSSMGATIRIEYEIDSHRKPELINVNTLRVKSVEKIQSTNRYKIKVYDDVEDLNELIQDDGTLSYLFQFAHPYEKWLYNPGTPIIPASWSSLLKDFVAEIHQGQFVVKDIYRESEWWVIETETDFGSFFIKKPTRTEPKLGGGYYEWRYQNPISIAGNVGMIKDHDNPGGGLRVKLIELVSSQANLRTYYSYVTDSLGTSSGVTPYDPEGMEKTEFHFPPMASLDDYFESDTTKASAQENYNKIVYENFSPLLAMSREIPAPGVTYEYVKVRQSVVSNGQEKFSPSYSRHHFQVFSKDLIGIDSVAYPVLNVNDDFDGINFRKIKRRDLVIKNLTSQVGQLKSTTLFDNNGNKINETINHYLFDQVNGATPVQKLADYQNLVETQFNGQGLLQETFIDSRFARRQGKYSLIGIISRRHTLPSIPTGQTVINYKTGIAAESKNLDFDFYSGQVTRSLSTDGYGNRYESLITPAYRVYPLMGPTATGGYNMLMQEASVFTHKVSATGTVLGLLSASAQTWSDNNMLLDHPELHGSFTLTTFGSATNGVHIATSPGTGNHLMAGERVTFIHNGNRYIGHIEEAEKKQSLLIWEYKIRLIGGSFSGSTLNNLSVNRLTVPRKRSAFSFIGNDGQALLPDGLHAVTDNQLPAFTAWNPGDPTPAGWQKNAEITLYDVYSHALEASDLNGQFAATKMTPDQTRVSATVANARYNEFTYSGAEEGATGSSLGNSVMLGTGATLSTSTAHTGSGAVKSSNQGFFTEADVSPGKKYTVSVWASKASATMKWVDGTGTTGTDVVLQLKRRAGDWYLLTGTVQPTQTHMKIWSQANGEETHFDDFRFHPFDAAMMSYVYNNWGELSHILDNNNLYTEYRYDAMGRLTSTYKETFMTPQEQARYGNNGIVKVSEVNYNYGANSPFMVPLTFTKSGSTGDIVYTGLPQVQQRKSFTFEIKENCITPKLASLMIDNQLINTAISTHTLLDGTIVKVNGKVVTLENVISPHTIYVTFNDFSNTGRAACFVVPRINEFGNTVYCRDGSFEYWYYNGCGEEQQRIRVFSINQVPTELRGYLPVEGCTIESGTNCIGNSDQ